MLMSSQQQQQRKGINPRQLVTIIEGNDVLLGRGNHVHNPGNAKFRMLVLSRSVEYWSCNNNVTKDAIARQIIDQISSSGGRFLRKLKNAPKRQPIDEEAVASSTVDAPTSDIWELADMETILVKVKQTFRDFTASAKKRTASTSLPVSSQHAVPLSSLIRPSSNTIHESNNISNILNQANTGTTSALDLGRLDHSLLSSRIIHNTGTERIRPSVLSTDVRDSLYQAARALQQGNLQDEFNQISFRPQLEELLTRQRAVASWQEHLRQQQLVSESSAYLNHNRQRDDQMSFLLQNNTLQDQLLLRQRLSQHTSHQPQTDMPLLTSAQNRPGESTAFPHIDEMLNLSNPNGFLQALEESNRARQQLLGSLDLHRATSYGALPLPLDTLAFRRAAVAPPYSEYETSYPSNNPNDINFLNTAVANAIAGHNLMSTMAADLPQLAGVVQVKDVDGDSDDDKKPPGAKK